VAEPPREGILRGDAELARRRHVSQTVVGCSGVRFGSDSSGEKLTRDRVGAYI
jgi:hypothetical protein